MFQNLLNILIVDGRQMSGLVVVSHVVVAYRNVGLNALIQTMNKSRIVSVNTLQSQKRDNCVMKQSVQLHGTWVHGPRYVTYVYLNK